MTIFKYAAPDLLDKDLVFDFIWFYSVFECALKQEGYLKSQKGIANADWKKFTIDIKDSFSKIEKDSFKKAIEYISENPPKQQYIQYSKLKWRNLNIKDKFSNEERVLLMVKTIRNNLFHGGKYQEGQILEVERSSELINAALEILLGCVSLHKGLTEKLEKYAV